MEKYIPVVVIKKLEETCTILKALKASGIYSAEITFRTEYAEEAIKLAVKEFPEMKTGAGTVINGEQCKRAIAAGAKFIVSPAYLEMSPSNAKKMIYRITRMCNTNGNYGGVKSRDYNGENFFPQIFTGTESSEASERALSADKIYSYRRYQ